MFRHDLIELITLDDSLRLDVVYATPDNFIGEAVYDSARCFLLRPVAEAVVSIHQELEAQGLGLLIYDGYRPWSVTRLFWDRVSEADRLYVADPVKGSRHNRGAAVDLTLFDRKTGAVLPMPSGFDEFTERAWMAYAGGTADEQRNRSLLVGAMEDKGFKVNSHEWWHFDFEGFERYPILDVSFETLENSLGTGGE